MSGRVVMTIRHAVQIEDFASNVSLPATYHLVAPSLLA